jgi:hypothetical protein
LLQLPTKTYNSVKPKAMNDDRITSQQPIVVVGGGGTPAILSHLT